MSFAIKDAANVTFMNKATSEPIFYTPDLNSFKLSLTGDSVFAKAKGADKIAFDGALKGTVEMESEVIGFDQLAVILSSTVVKESSRVGRRKLLKVDGSKKVVLTGIIPVTGSISVFSLESDKKAHKEKLTITSTTASQNTEITITGSTVTAGDEVAVYYLVDVPNTKKIVVKNESSAPNYTVYGDAYAKDENGVNQVLALKLPNCKVERAIELSFTAENPSTFTTKMSVLPDENGEYVVLSFIGDGATAMAADFLENVEAITLPGGDEIQLKKK